MQVLMVCDYRLRPDRVGGIDRFYWALQQRMQRAGWNVRWLFPDDSDHQHYLGRGFEIVRVPRGQVLEGVAPVLARSGPPDLLVSIFTPYATRYPLTWRRLGVRHYLALDHMSRPASMRSASVRARLAKGILLYPFLSGIVAISGFVRKAILQELGSHWSRKIEVIPNGVDTSIFCPSAEPQFRDGKDVHVVVVSHLIPEKGVQVLLRAVAARGDRLRHIRVSVAGDGDYRHELERLAEELGLGDRVSFLGSTACQDSLLRSADIAVVPSLWREAFSLAVIEAMATGVPVVASDIGGIRELIQRSDGTGPGYLVPPGDVDALGTALEELAGDAALRRRCGEAGVRLARARYNLERMTYAYFSHMQRFAA